LRHTFRHLARLTKPRTTLLAFLCSVFACAALAQPATERYEYDTGGRLVRWVDQQGNVTDYLYDASGNILEVRRGGAPEATAVTDVNPNVIRRGESVILTVTGTGLTGATITSPDPELDVTGVRTGATSASLRLTATPNAAFGPRTLTLQTATGQATFAVTVNPAQPKIMDMPDPIVLRPDNAPQTLTLELSSADIVAHTVNLAIDNTAIATIAPLSVIFAPGETSKTVTVRGLVLGITRLILTSPTLAANATGIYVTAPFSGSGTSVAPDVGVRRPELPTPVPAILVAPTVGVVRPELPPATPSTLVGPDVGVVRPETNGGTAPGTLLAPNVGVDRTP
jgi:YD repeat-containing protein